MVKNGNGTFEERAALAKQVERSERYRIQLIFLENGHLTATIAMHKLNTYCDKIQESKKC